MPALNLGRLSRRPRTGPFGVGPAAVGPLAVPSGAQGARSAVRRPGSPPRFTQGGRTQSRQPVSPQTSPEHWARGAAHFLQHRLGGCASRHSEAGRLEVSQRRASLYHAQVREDGAWRRHSDVHGASRRAWDLRRLAASKPGHHMSTSNRPKQTPTAVRHRRGITWRPRSSCKDRACHAANWAARLGRRRRPSFPQGSQSVAGFRRLKTH